MTNGRTWFAVLGVWSLTVLFTATATAASHRPRLHPNPEITIFDIAEGADGLLWLAAADGLYRYDGFRYLKVDSPVAHPVRYVGVTGDGSVWAGGTDGLYRDRGPGFELELPGSIEELAALPGGVLALVAQEGVYYVPVEGPISRPIDGLRQFLTLDSEGNPWHVCGQPPAHDMFACTLDERFERRMVEPLPLWATGVLPDRHGRWLITDPSRAELTENGETLKTFERRAIQATMRPAPLAPGADGQVWFIGETTYGIDPAIELRERADPDMLTYPTDALEDSRGRLWVAWKGRGLVEWTIDPGWERWYLDDFSGESPAQLGRDLDGAMVAAAGDALFRLNPERRWNRLERLGARIAAFHAHPDGGFLASLREFGLAQLDDDGRLVRKAPLPPDPSPRKYISDQFREILPAPDGSWWVGGKTALLKIEPKTLALEDNFPMPGTDISVPIHLRGDNTPDLEIGPDGRLWVASPYGVVIRGSDDDWQWLPTERRIDPGRSLAPGAEDVWVAHRSGGPYFTRLVREEETWRVEQFRADEGYPPADSHFIKRDSRGWIWRGSTEGVHVADGRRFGPDDWLHLHTGNGLTANLTEIYGFHEDDDGSVWLTGFEGVTRVEPDPTWFETPTNARPPAVSRLTVDGAEHGRDEPIPTGAYEMVLLVGALDAPPFRDRPLRYRFAADQEWRFSRDGRIRIEQPDDGDYRLEVAFSSDAAGTPPSLVHSFRVGPPAPWSGWPWLLGGLGALTCLALAVAPRWREGLFYRLSKAWFLTKRSWEASSSVTPSGSTGPSAELEPGDRLRGRYRVDRVLSTGGFSTVYLSTDLEGSGSSVAIKVLAPRPGADRWVRDRFVHEVASLRTIAHPGVVPILDSWVSSDGSPCLVMPFLEGPTLRQDLDREGAFSRRRAARLLRRLGEAVAAVHAHGIVHRDLKPENILLARAPDSGEQPVLIDFGLAAIRAAEGELAGTTMMAGSLPYMAPERLLNRFSPASDLYSLAVLTLELVTGRRPSDGQHDGQEEDYEPERLAERVKPYIGARRARRLGELLSAGLALLARSRPADAAAWCSEAADVLESD